ncbi:ATP-binding cassette subfamily C member 4-like isoform X3 [Neodiprion virginianus]|uniref:ATP-binding cassette subfamily C member 4-like isoform X3 n=1 Tax=Neodiprion virginianus TaxID=2961670 RepID=UPI001EE696E4|nr:ATP-binding cassette subfamily C member 4-like isoform X3 [Neodiprion virginianus]
MHANNETRDRKNLEERSNIFSLLFFGWTFPIFREGARRNLKLEDLYDPLKSDASESLSDRLEKEWKKELMNANRNWSLARNQRNHSRPRPSLMWTLIRILWAPYLVQGLLLFAQLMVLRVLQPILQGWIIDYFNQAEEQITQNDALLYSVYLVVVTLSVVFVTHHTDFRNRQTGMRARVACCSLIYRKVLRLDQNATNNAAGLIANLMSNDVARFDSLPAYFHFVWISPFQVVLIGYVMWQIVGPTSLVGIVVMMLQTIPLQGYLSTVSRKLRSKIAAKTDYRVQLMSELISGIQVVKMYAWEKPFELIVSKVRAVEMKLVGYTSYLRGIYLSITVFTEKTTLFLTLIVFVLNGNSLTANITFVLSTLFNVLQFTCAICLPKAILMAGETAVSLERITDFLLLDESKSLETVDIPSVCGVQTVEEPTTSGHQTDNGIGIQMINVGANWIDSQIPPTLCHISLDLKNQSLCALVGSIGSGKSSLLHLILGELKLGAGSVSFYCIENGIRTTKNSHDIRISYAGQNPWVFLASIRENILFGQPYDESRYQEVIRVCALVEDFEQFPQGDLSCVGEKGASLSGGQRARINLARAIYRDADVYLLDDPLSAVDTGVARHLFEECIKGFLDQKTRILVTHQVQYLQQADTVIVLDRGMVKCQGTYENLVQSQSQLLTSEQSKELDELGRIKKNIQVTPTATNSNDQLAEEFKTAENSRDIPEEEVMTGNMSSQVYWSYFLAGGNICSLIFIATIFVIGQVATTGIDYWVSYWSNQEAIRFTLQSKRFNTSNTSSHMNIDDNQPLLYSTSHSQWIDEFGLLHQDVAIYIYAGCIVSCIILVTLRHLLFMKMCVNASCNLHNSMFANILVTTMRFFNTNPSGRILNRFSKDMGAMDELLPNTMLEALQILTMMIGMFTIVAVVNPWMIIPIVIINGIFYVIRFYYLKTAQDIKRLEGIGNFLGGSVGLAISQSLAMSGVVQYGMWQTAEVISQMTSVERVLQYTNLPKEGPFTTEQPPSPTWPSDGGLIFKNVTMRYADNEPPVLKGLNVDIKPGWKVGIVGRTGAGKSSLVSALFRLHDGGTDGEIIIDGINTRSVGLHELRRGISIIPQEPILFSETLRYNLDPFGHYSDTELWHSLREVELENMISSLDIPVAEGGANFSVGQRQLICLARAILKENKLLVLDEVTANIDPITDKLIQNTISRRFAECTVVTIAHRLNTVMNSDRVLVMGEGRILEYDHPHLLLKDRNGYFSQMLQQTGTTVADELAAISERNYNSQPNIRVREPSNEVITAASE